MQINRQIVLVAGRRNDHTLVLVEPDAPDGVSKVTHARVDYFSVLGIPVLKIFPAYMRTGFRESVRSVRCKEIYEWIIEQKLEIREKLGDLLRELLDNARLGIILSLEICMFLSVIIAFFSDFSFPSLYLRRSKQLADRFGSYPQPIPPPQLNTAPQKAMHHFRQKVASGMIVTSGQPGLVLEAIRRLIGTLLPVQH